MIRSFKNVIFYFIFLLFLQSCSYGKEEEKGDFLSVQTVISQKEALNGKRINTFGFVVIEFEKMNIYSSEEDYYKTSKGQKSITSEDFTKSSLERCMGLNLSNYQFSRREALNKRTLLVSGVVDKDLCGKDEICPMFCNEFGLKDIEILTPYWEKLSVPTISPKENPNLVTDQSSKDFQKMDTFSRDWLNAVLEKNQRVLAGMFFSKSADIAALFKNPDSRLSWLLFESPNSVLNTFKDTQNVQTNYLKFDWFPKNMEPKEGVGIACFCKDKPCDSKFVDPTPFYQSFRSQYFCILLTDSNGKLFVDLAQFE